MVSTRLRTGVMMLTSGRPIQATSFMESFSVERFEAGKMLRRVEPPTRELDASFEARSHNASSSIRREIF